MNVQKPRRTNIFIVSHSNDRFWLEQCLLALRQRGYRSHDLQLWDETVEVLNEHWRETLEHILEAARVVILLISPSFLASKILTGEEVSQQLKAAQQEGALILPIILSSVGFQTTLLGPFQPFNEAAQPLEVLNQQDLEATWFKLGDVVYETLHMPYPLKNTRLIYTGHLDRVGTVAWIPTGTYLASGGGSPRDMEEAETHDFTIHIWEASTSQLLTTCSGHVDTVEAVAWAPDGQRLASASRDQTVRVWDVMTGQSLLIYRGHVDEVLALAWAPNGRYLVSTGGDKTVQVWDATTGQRLVLYRGHANDVLSIAPRAYGQLISEVWSVAWAPDGTRIASGGDHTVQVWEATTGQQIVTYHGHKSWVRAVAWASDSQRLASASADGTVQVWLAESGQHLYTYHSHPYGAMVAVDWKPDNTLLASTGGYSDHTIQVWEATTGRAVYSYGGHTNSVHAVAWSPDGKYIASCGEDRTVQIWTPE